jgi:hypothetical protein
MLGRIALLPIPLMAENQRTGFVWQTFMQNPEAANAMALAGFTAD